MQQKKICLDQDCYNQEITDMKKDTLYIPVFIVCLMIMMFVFFSVFYALAFPTITVKQEIASGVLYQHRDGAICFIPKADTGIYSDDVTRAIWLASAVKDKSKFNLLSYNILAMQRRCRE